MSHLIRISDESRERLNELQSMLIADGALDAKTMHSAVRFGIELALSHRKVLADIDRASGDLTKIPQDELVALRDRLNAAHTEFYGFERELISALSRVFDEVLKR